MRSPEPIEELLGPLLSPPAGSRRERQAWVDERAEELAALMADAARQITRNAVEGYASSLTASDVARLDGMEALWLGFIEEVVGEYTAGMFLGGSLSAFVQGPAGQLLDPEVAVSWAATVNDAALSYQATATNRIVGASANMWADVRTKTVDGLAAGMSNEALKEEIEAITGYSEFRADTIGRTETMAAYAGGDMAGARALGENGPSHKRWLAAIDARTRDTHLDADGQMVPINEPFIVGGVPMDRPLDPGAPPGEVVNCRCVVELLYPEDIEDES